MVKKSFLFLSQKGERGHVFAVFFAPFPEKGILDHIAHRPIIQAFTVSVERLAVLCFPPDDHHSLGCKKKYGMGVFTGLKYIFYLFKISRTHICAIIISLHKYLCLSRNCGQWNVLRNRALLTPTPKQRAKNARRDIYPND